MKKVLIIFLFLGFLLIFLNDTVYAQCAMCTKTASQLGEKPALGLNNAILYLMGAPFLIVGYIGFRWWKNNKEMENSDSGTQS